MDKQHTARLFLTAGATLLTACTAHGWPLVVGGLLLMILAIVLVLLVSRDARTPLERIAVLMCILRRIDPSPYLRLPQPRCRKGKPKASHRRNTDPPRRAEN